jgi:hypothetical protein
MTPITTTDPGTITTSTPDPRCELEHGDDDHPCGAPAVARMLASCASWHDDATLLCERCLACVLQDGVSCTACTPRAPAFVVAVEWF